jgi:hypothetical protein
MVLIETLKTIYLEFGFIKNHISKKTNERILQKKISNMFFKDVNLNKNPSDTTRKLYQKHLNK